MNNQMIGKCELCQQQYCQECTDDGCDWKRFCSLRCERETAQQEDEFVAQQKKTRKRGK